MCLHSLFFTKRGINSLYLHEMSIKYMKKIGFTLLLLFQIAMTFSQQQTTTKKMNTTTKNPLLCDVKTGVCGDSLEEIIHSEKAAKGIKMIYFTDPICSSCWGIEPQLRKLKLEYGSLIEIEYRMGGLLPDWSYNSGGISKPSDVAHHWDEVSITYDMPIDGDVWLEDPLASSYPPSIAFKAAQFQGEEKAHLLLRELREMVFLKKINIAKWENITVAAKKVGLNIEELKKDYENKGNVWFKEDLKLAREMGVRGFPTVFFVNEKGDKEIIYGSRAYPFYEMAILKLAPELVKKEYKKDWESIFSIYPTLTALEYSVLTGTPRKDSEELLNELTKQGRLNKLITKNGSVWSII